MNKIKLYNRDGVDLYLVPKEDYYVLDGPDLYKSYLRIIFDSSPLLEEKTIYAIDPPGGPFLPIGYNLGGKIISKITFKEGEGTKIYLKDETD